jgi:AcrR family transcriptional regulator
MARRYELKQRAESKTATRQRIVEATVALHESVGFGTTISAIAERAGVQRLTVYRHFPDERSLFDACAGHWRAENPAPDTSPWAALDDPDERLQLALREIYAFFRRTEDMTGNLLRDLPDSPTLREVAAPLLEERQRDPRPRLEGARVAANDPPRGHRTRARVRDLALTHARRPRRQGGRASDGRTRTCRAG